MSSLERLKAAYKAWDECKGLRPEIWLDLLADTVHIQSLGGEAQPLAFARNRKSKAEVVQYFAGLAQHWTMVHWTPQTFVTEGDKIAVFATCGWTNKATGKTVETPSAHLWQFENGYATSMIELFDSARVMAAATP
ncbi:MAG: nuclear transport factor 2 family protein [Hyphomicrobiaceae bacterium]